MTVLHARAGALAAASEHDVLVLWRRRLAGELSEPAFTRLAALVVARSNLRAVMLADLALTAALMHHLADVVHPLGLQPTDAEIDAARLGAAVGTVLAAEIKSVSTAEELVESRRVRLARLARAEPLSTTQDALGRAMTERDVAGWTRETSAKPCPLCTQWADGQIRPPTVRMARHTGCSCVQQPAFT